MAVRFRKSIKLAPGLRINFSKGTPSLTLGQRGGSLNISKRGLISTVGIPGTGISYRKRLNGLTTQDRQEMRRLEKEQAAEQRRYDIMKGEVNVVNGEIVCHDRFGEPLKPKEMSQLWQEFEPAITKFLHIEMDKVNHDDQILRTIYHDIPTFDRSADGAESYPIPRPIEPLPVAYPDKPNQHLHLPIRWYHRLFKSLGRKIQLQNEAIDARNDQLNQQWIAACNAIDQANIEQKQSYLKDKKQWELNKAAFDIAILSDERTMEEILEKALSRLEWPREVSLSFQVNSEKKLVQLDIDLPEIEDMPMEHAVMSTTGKRFMIKPKSGKQIRMDYAWHIHGVILRLIALAFQTLPAMETVIASGYSQRFNEQTKAVNDEYLLSVLATRKQFQAIDLTDLASSDPIAIIDQFDVRKKMTATGIFKAIAPF